MEGLAGEAIGRVDAQVSHRIPTKPIYRGLGAVCRSIGQDLKSLQSICALGRARFLQNRVDCR
ncbi:hypothetical protein ABB55_14240 [Prosthecomicrobium hirschii]|uniref:Uncharacterized protein n=1 Tax=Prosthecodimorpha hirschii TaxID=665126 RepID=A0A0P6WF51_9HYPH|nr:hypothetical protein ABB55_14240 [Prosthecomicrobium hirschii]